MNDLACCASPRKGGVPSGPLGSADTKIRTSHADDSDDLSFGDRALSLFGGKPKKKKEPKEPKSEEPVEELGFGDRALSLFGGKPRANSSSEPLPANWKKAKDKDGKVYYFNSVTQVRQYTMPRQLPKGWTEALHKESGRVYYVHKATRKTTFAFPQDSDADEEEEDDRDKDDGFMSKTLSFATGGMLGGKSFAKSKKKDEEAKPADSSPRKKETTVFISCTTLIKEVKLCVDASKHPPLDALLENLVNRKVSAEEAVKHLQTLVGTTLVQQAGMSVKNAKTGTLPHGWLEYTDERSGRSYYYNVHTKVTTWYKPKKDDVAPAAKAAEDVLKSDRNSSHENNVNIEFDMKTHTIAMAADL